MDEAFFNKRPKTPGAEDISYSNINSSPHKKTKSPQKKMQAVLLTNDVSLPEFITKRPPHQVIIWSCWWNRWWPVPTKKSMRSFGIISCKLSKLRNIWRIWTRLNHTKLLPKRCFTLNYIKIVVRIFCITKREKDADFWFGWNVDPLCWGWRTIWCVPNGAKLSK